MPATISDAQPHVQLTHEPLPQFMLTGHHQIDVDQDAFLLTTAVGPLGELGSILAGHAVARVYRSPVDDEHWFTWRISLTDIGRGTLDSISVPLPGPYYPFRSFEVGYTTDDPSQPKMIKADFGVQSITFSGLGVKGTGRGEAGHSSGTLFLRSTAKAYARGGRSHYSAVGGSKRGVPGSVRAFVPVLLDLSKHGEQFESIHLGAIEAGGGGLVFVPGSGFQPVPPPRPDAIAQRLAELANLHQAATAWASPALAETIHHEVRQELAALSQIHPDKGTEAL
jgi:hypothetical protein